MAEISTTDTPEAGVRSTNDESGIGATPSVRPAAEATRLPMIRARSAQHAAKPPREDEAYADP